MLRLTLFRHFQDFQRLVTHPLPLLLYGFLGWQRIDSQRIDSQRSQRESLYVHDHPRRIINSLFFADVCFFG